MANNRKNSFHRDYNTGSVFKQRVQTERSRGVRNHPDAFVHENKMLQTTLM